MPTHLKKEDLPNYQIVVNEMYRRGLNLITSALHEEGYTYTYEHFVLEFMESFPEESNCQWIAKLITFTAYTVSTDRPEALFAWYYPNGGWFPDKEAFLPSGNPLRYPYN